MAEELEINNVSKYFGKLCALSDVSFSVNENEIYGIAGPNGAGKTTLFNAITGLPFSPDMGHVIFNGRSIEKMLPHEICHLGIARTFQRETVFDTMTVLENVKVGAIYGHAQTSKKDIKTRVTDALNLVGLEANLNEPARHLALFDKKRLMLASALVTEPKILLLDEPAAGLNRVEVQQTVDLIQRINSTGITIVLIEHVLSLLLKLSHRIMILNEGSKLLEGLPKQVVQDERVIEAYLGGRR